MLSEDPSKQLKKVWINLYGNKLTDEQVCQLAAKHNIENTGSWQTKWLERVTTCREWLFQINKKDVAHDETPPSSTAWKKACQIMYLEEGKVSYFSFSPLKENYNCNVFYNNTLNKTLNLVHRFSRITYIYTENLLFQL